MRYRFRSGHDRPLRHGRQGEREPEKPEDDEEEDDNAPEIVTLEEADAEAEGGGEDVPDIDGEDVDVRRR